MRLYAWICLLGIHEVPASTRTFDRGCSNHFLRKSCGNQYLAPIVPEVVREYMAFLDSPLTYEQMRPYPMLIEQNS